MDTNATKGGWGAERSRYRGAARGLVVWHPEGCRHSRFQFLAHDSSLSVVSADAPVVAIQSRAPTRKLTDVVPVCRVIFMESHDSL